MLNERPEGKDKFGYVLIGLLVAFVIILVTSAVIWNSNHPEKVQENFEKIDTQQAEEAVDSVCSRLFNLSNTMVTHNIAIS